MYEQLFALVVLTLVLLGTTRDASHQHSQSSTTFEFRTKNYLTKACRRFTLQRATTPQSSALHPRYSPRAPGPAASPPSYGPSSNVLSSQRPPSKASSSWRPCARCLSAQPPSSQGRKVNPLDPGSVLQDQFWASQWIKWGWTLQEFIASRSAQAPCLLYMAGLRYERELRGRHRRDHRYHIRDSHRIPSAWPWSDRVTAQGEDRAYSLIFGVSLPTIFAEAGFAIIRLQEYVTAPPKPSTPQAIQSR